MNTRDGRLRFPRRVLDKESYCKTPTQPVGRTCSESFVPPVLVSPSAAIAALVRKFEMASEGDIGVCRPLQSGGKEGNQPARRLPNGTMPPGQGINKRRPSVRIIPSWPPPCGGGQKAGSTQVSVLVKTGCSPCNAPAEEAQNQGSEGSHGLSCDPDSHVIRPRLSAAVRRLVASRRAIIGHRKAISRRRESLGRSASASGLCLGQFPGDRQDMAGSSHGTAEESPERALSLPALSAEEAESVRTIHRLAAALPLSTPANRPGRGSPGASPVSTPTTGVTMSTEIAAQSSPRHCTPGPALSPEGGRACNSSGSPTDLSGNVDAVTSSPGDWGITNSSGQLRRHCGVYAPSAEGGEQGGESSPDAPVGGHRGDAASSAEGEGGVSAQAPPARLRCGDVPSLAEGEEGVGCRVGACQALSRRLGSLKVGEANPSEGPPPQDHGEACAEDQQAEPGDEVMPRTPTVYEVRRSVIRVAAGSIEGVPPGGPHGAHGHMRCPMQLPWAHAPKEVAPPRQVGSPCSAAEQHQPDETTLNLLLQQGTIAGSTTTPISAERPGSQPRTTTPICAERPGLQPRTMSAVQALSLLFATGQAQIPALPGHVRLPARPGQALRQATSATDAGVHNPYGPATNTTISGHVGCIPPTNHAPPTAVIGPGVRADASRSKTPQREANVGFPRSSRPPWQATMPSRGSHGVLPGPRGQATLSGVATASRLLGQDPPLSAASTGQATNPGVAVASRSSEAHPPFSPGPTGQATNSGVAASSRTSGAHPSFSPGAREQATISGGAPASQLPGGESPFPPGARGQATGLGAATVSRLPGQGPTSPDGPSSPPRRSVRDLVRMWCPQAGPRHASPQQILRGVGTTGGQASNPEGHAGMRQRAGTLSSVAHVGMRHRVETLSYGGHEEISQRPETLSCGAHVGMSQQAETLSREVAVNICQRAETLGHAEHVHTGQQAEPLSHRGKTISVRRLAEVPISGRTVGLCQQWEALSRGDRVGVRPPWETLSTGGPAGFRCQPETLGHVGDYEMQPQAKPSCRTDPSRPHQQPETLTSRVASRVAEPTLAHVGLHFLPPALAAATGNASASLREATRNASPSPFPSRRLGWLNPVGPAGDLCQPADACPCDASHGPMWRPPPPAPGDAPQTLGGHGSVHMVGGAELLRAENPGLSESLWRAENPCLSESLWRAENPCLSESLWRAENPCLSESLWRAENPCLTVGLPHAEGGGAPRAHTVTACVVNTVEQLRLVTWRGACSSGPSVSPAASANTTSSELSVSPIASANTTSSGQSVSPAVRPNASGVFTSPTVRADASEESLRAITSRRALSPAVGANASVEFTAPVVRALPSGESLAPALRDNTSGRALCPAAGAHTARRSLSPAVRPNMSGQPPSPAVKAGMSGQAPSVVSGTGALGESPSSKFRSSAPGQSLFAALRDAVTGHPPSEALRRRSTVPDNAVPSTKWEEGGALRRDAQCLSGQPGVNCNPDNQGRSCKDGEMLPWGGDGRSLVGEGEALCREAARACCVARPTDQPQGDASSPPGEGEALCRHSAIACCVARPTDQAQGYNAGCLKGGACASSVQGPSTEAQPKKGVIEGLDTVILDDVDSLMRLEEGLEPSLGILAGEGSHQRGWTPSPQREGRRGAGLRLGPEEDEADVGAVAWAGESRALGFGVSQQVERAGDRSAEGFGLSQRVAGAGDMSAGGFGLSQQVGGVGNRSAEGSGLSQQVDRAGGRSAEGSGLSQLLGWLGYRLSAGYQVAGAAVGLGEGVNQLAWTGVGVRAETLLKPLAGLRARYPSPP